MGLCLVVDASSIGVGAILHQKVNDHWKPVFFFCNKFSPTEIRYSTFGCELPMMYSAVLYFQHLLKEWIFDILTHHKPLQGMFQSISHKFFPHETGDRLYNWNCWFIKGVDNITTDSMCPFAWIPIKNRQRISNYSSLHCTIPIHEYGKCT